MRNNILSILGILLMIGGFGLTTVKITYWPDNASRIDFYNFRTAVAAGIIGLIIVFASRMSGKNAES